MAPESAQISLREEGLKKVAQSAKSLAVFLKGKIWESVLAQTMVEYLIQEVIQREIQP